MEALIRMSNEVRDLSGCLGEEQELADERWLGNIDLYDERWYVFEQLNVCIMVLAKYIHISIL